MTREETRKAWIAALRSGKFPQAHESALKSERGYCCLGVACEIILGPGEVEHSGRISWEGCTALPPEIIVDRLGLRDRNGSLEDTTHFERDGEKYPAMLTAMNDKGHTFAEIADFIEANPEQVFVNDAG